MTHGFQIKLVNLGFIFRLSLRSSAIVSIQEHFFRQLGIKCLVLERTGPKIEVGGFSLNYSHSRATIFHNSFFFDLYFKDSFSKRRILNVRNFDIQPHLQETVCQQSHML